MSTLRQALNELQDKARNFIITLLLVMVKTKLRATNKREVNLLFSIDQFFEEKLIDDAKYRQDQIDIIAYAFKIHPDRFFERTREREIIEARQFFWWYKIRKEGYPPSYAQAFGFHRATAIHSKKTIDNYFETGMSTFVNKAQEAIGRLEKLTKKAA